jgi:hypothetical protein
MTHQVILMVALHATTVNSHSQSPIVRVLYSVFAPMKLILRIRQTMTVFVVFLLEHLVPKEELLKLVIRALSYHHLDQVQQFKLLIIVHQS